MDEAIFLVCEDEIGIQGFTCANLKTSYVWALFAIDAAQGRRHRGSLVDAAMARLREAGRRQAFLTTGVGMKAGGFLSVEGFSGDGGQHEGGTGVSAVALIARHPGVSSRS